MSEPRCPIANMVCPRNNDPQQGKYCPAWVEFMQTNTATGEERLQKMCWFQAAPEFMVEVIKASNRPAEAIESTRNEIVKGFGKVSWILQEGQQDELEDNSDD